jgi:hypothetical protein
MPQHFAMIWHEPRVMETMKEYQSAATETVGFPNIANQMAKDGWRVVSVIPHRYLPPKWRRHTKLADIVIFFERNSVVNEQK